MFLISDAYAEDAPVAGAQTPPAFASFVPLILIFVVFYFLLIRPQQKKYKDHQATLAAIEKGDEVTTGGGILGKVVKVEEGDILHVQIAENTEVRVARSTIAAVTPKRPKAANDNA